jgi:hypothetical protein
MVDPDARKPNGTVAAVSAGMVVLVVIADAGEHATRRFLAH